MDKNKLNAILRKLNAYRRDPELVREPTLDEMATLIFFFVDQINSFEEAIKSGKLDGYTPQPGKDYPSREEMTKMLTNLVNDEVKRLAKLSDEHSQKITDALNNLRQPKDGKDAEVTEEMMAEIAKVASELVELPDFDALIEERTTASPDSIRNGLELLVDQPESEKLDPLAIQMIPQGRVEGLNEELERIKREGGTGPGGTRKTRLNEILGLYIQDTDPGNVEEGSIWIRTS